MNLILKLAILLLTLKAVTAIQCYYFPREFISHEKISNDTIQKYKCTSATLAMSEWNQFVTTQVNFLHLQQCVVYNGTNLVASGSCIDEVSRTLQPLFNNPLCKIAPVQDDTWACIFDPLNPCLKSEQAGPKGNVLSLLCKIKQQDKEWLRGLKGSLKYIELGHKQLEYYTVGRYIDVHSLRRSSSSSVNKDTFDFIGNFMCSKHPDGNCCNGPSGCNLPKRLNQTSLYASVGAKQIIDAFAKDGYLRQYLASAAGIHDVRHPSSENELSILGRSGSTGHRTASKDSWLPTNNSIVAATLGALAFACVALLASLLGVCYTQRRAKIVRRRLSQSDSFLKSPTPPPQTPQPQPLLPSSQHQHRQQRRHVGDAAEKLLSASTSSTSASAMACPAPAGVALIADGNAQQKRMFAVPNNRPGGTVAPVVGGVSGGSSGVGTSGGDSLPSSSTESQQAKLQQLTSSNTDAVAVAFDDSQTGSGSGQPILLPRTVAREIEHRELIGQGRFGQVYRSEWRNDPVAVKIFSSRAESSWSTEGHMYELPGMRHDAILGFIAIDNIDIGLETQLWLITDYHANGSLQSYLTRCTVDQLTMARMLHSIASGLAHLHSEISGVKCKPAIAHRDIKSNNILVKSDLSCCLADFGLAVALQPGCGVVIGLGSGGIGGIGGSDSGIGETQNNNNNNNGRVGTRRYLSPECLNGSQDARDFTALRKADIYATGLVFWELAARCHDPARGVEAEPVYQQPYQGLVPNNPTLEEMQAVVCPPASSRPPLSPIWREHPVLGRLCNVMTECWYESPAARLEAMSVKDQTARMLLTANQLLAADREVGTAVA